MIKKAIIPLGGLGTRFLPLSKVVPKELWPLATRPMVEYIVEEAKKSGISHIIFVVKPGHEEVLQYFRKSPSLEKLLTKKKKEKLLAELKALDDLARDITFSSVAQETPLGDGDAALQAKRLVGKEPCGVLFVDDIVVSKVPCFEQLARTFKTCQKPVLALKRIPKDKLGRYGVVEVEKIANRFYKIKKIVEKPHLQEAPSDFAVVGKYIITPEVFEYLSQAQPNSSGEVILADTFNRMISDGKVIYGYEFEGEWLECGSKKDWMRANLRLILQNPDYRKEAREYLK